jgi:hypothetical protein
MKKILVLLFAAVLAISVATPAFASTYNRHRRHHRHHRQQHHAVIVVR